MRWLSPAFRPHPDIEALNDSGHRKYKSIDVKLGVAMTAMLRAGSDRAAELYLEVNRKSNEYVRDYDGKIIKGRQIIAMMYESFRTQDRSDMIVSLDYLIKLPYTGDAKLHQFKQTWMEILVRMRREDIPSKKALRDCLYNKIKDSPAMKWELGLRYEHLPYDHPDRTYDKLLTIMDRVIMRKREQSNLAQTHAGLRQMLEGKDLLAAPARVSDKEKTPSAPAPKGGGGKPSKGNGGKTDDAAPVLPQSKAKAHAKTKFKKKKDERGESTDPKSKKNIRCKFHFTDSGCRNGKDCPYSHSKKTPERPPGGGRSRTPSPSGNTSNKLCYSFKNHGSCSRANCPYKHEKPDTPATPAPNADAKAKAKAEAKPKAEPSTPATKGKPKGKAKPAAPAIQLCRAWNPLAPAIQKRITHFADEESDASSVDSDADSECSTDDERPGPVLPTRKHNNRRVSFAKDTNFKSSNPRKSYKEQGGEIIKINIHRFIADEKRANDLEFAKHKARLKAQIFKDMLDDGEDGDRIAHLRVPGTAKVIEIIFYDGEDELRVRKLNLERQTPSLYQCVFNSAFFAGKRM